MDKMKKTLCLAAVLATSLCAAAVEWEKPVPIASDPVSGGAYYIYDYSQEKFFNAGEMTLTLSPEGTPITFKQKDDGDWLLKGPIGHLFSDLDMVGCDAGSDEFNTAWYIEKQAAGTYYLRPSKNDPTFPWADNPDTWMGFSYSAWKFLPLLKPGEGDIEWYIVMEADYDFFLSKVSLNHLMTELQGYGYDVSNLVTVYNTATDKATIEAAVAAIEDDIDQLRMDNATEDRPYDVTGKFMRNADLTENWEDNGHDVPGWTMVPASFCGMGEFDNEGFYPDNKTLASWTAAAFGDNKVYQELTNLKNGKYRFGNYGLWIRHTGEEGDPIEGAYIYAKVGDKTFREPLADTGWWRGLSEVVFECRTGNAEVGIMFEGTNVGQCVILDFKLEYMGETPLADRFNALIAKAQALINENAINNTYVETLNADIKKCNDLIAAGDAEAGEAHFLVFEKDIDEALANKEAYSKLAELMEKAQETLDLGESDEMSELSDYLIDNDLEEGVKNHNYDNAAIDKITVDLNNLIEKAANSVTEAGADVTDLLINGHFDTNGGWTATLNDFSINPDLKVMERWWADWKAEQVLTNVTNGTYRLEVQGFQWCHWDWSGADTDWANGDGSSTFNVKSKIRLNDNEVTIHNVFACGETDITEGFQTSAGYFVPNDATTAIPFFELGLYNNVVETTVTDNTLKVEFDCSQQGFWNCFYNLRLIFVGADTQEAFGNLKDAVAQANKALSDKMQGDIRKAIEEALENANTILGDKHSKYNDINQATKNILGLIDQATGSVKEYSRLAATLALAEETLKDEQAAQTDAGQQLQALYNSTKNDYDSDYPTLDNEGIVTTIDNIETLITQAKIGAGIKPGDDITLLITNPSFENTYENDIAVGGAAHTVPYGWSMTVEGKECHTAQELYDAGINSFTAIESNPYTTDGEYSYCLLSAPVPDSYLWQTLKGLPAGTYKVTVDMNVTYEGGCSRLTGQRLLVNNVAQYYGKPEFYVEPELDNLHPEFGVRTDNNKSATTRNYEENWWDCCGRFKIDNFHLFYVSTEVSGIEALENAASSQDGAAYNLMGIKVDPASVRGIYIKNGKKYYKH